MPKPYPHCKWYTIFCNLGIACVLGTWVHFIPCIWWTCDFSINDNAGIRGGIWFALWALLFLLSLLSCAKPEGCLVTSQSAEEDVWIPFKKKELTPEMRLFKETTEEIDIVQNI